MAPTLRFDTQGQQFQTSEPATESFQMKSKRDNVKAGHAMAAFCRGLALRAAAAMVLVLLAPLITLILITLAVTGRGRRTLTRQLCLDRNGNPFLLLRFRKRMPEDGPWMASFIQTLERCDLHRLPHLINAARGEVIGLGDAARPWPPLTVEAGRQHAADRLRGLRQ